MQKFIILFHFIYKFREKIRYKKGDFPEAEIQAKELLTLPIHQYINKQHLDYMINIICKFYNISL